MSIDTPGERGLAAARFALDAGEAIVVACPSPLPYAVASTGPVTVNGAEGRPAEQPLGVGLGRLDLVLPHLQALDAPTVRFARWLSGTELVSVMLPAARRPRAGPVAGPFHRRGPARGHLAWHPDARSLLEDHGHLYISSANRSGRTVAATAAQADAEFGGELLVLDSDAHRDQSVPAGSAAIVRVTAGSTVQLERAGIHNAAFDDDTDAFLIDLRRRWLASTPAAQRQ